VVHAAERHAIARIVVVALLTLDDVRGIDGTASFWCQYLGFHLRAVRPGVVDRSRRMIKPSISERGAFGIPLRDELELGLPLG
jgi:hypothetical protein